MQRFRRSRRYDRLVIVGLLASVAVIAAAQQQPAAPTGGTMANFTGGVRSLDAADVRAVRFQYDAGARSYWHAHDGVHTTHEPSLLRQRVEELNARLGGTPRIVLGCEVRFTHDLFRQVCSTRTAPTINDGRYVLVEFPHMVVPPGSERPLFDLLNKVMQMLGGRCDHCQCNIGTFTDAPNNMVGRNACHAGIGYRFGSCWIAISSKCDCFGEASTLRQNVDHSFLAGWRNAIEFYPTVDHNEKSRCRVPLAK